MPYTRKTKSKNKRKTMKGGVSPSRSSRSSSSRSSSISGSPVNTWTDLKLVLENNNPLINLNLYHGNQFRNLLDDAVQVAKTLTKKEKELINKWVKVEKGKSPPVYSNREITIWKKFLDNFPNQIK